MPSGQLEHLLYQSASIVLHGTLLGANPRVYSMPNPNVLCEDFLTLFPFQTIVGVIRAEHVRPLPAWCLSWPETSSSSWQARCLARYLPSFQGDVDASLNYDILSQGNSTNER